MLIEDYFAETKYIVSALKLNYEHSRDYLADFFGLFKRNGCYEDYCNLMGLITTNLAITEHIENLRKEYHQKIEEVYENRNY